MMTDAELFSYDEVDGPEVANELAPNGSGGGNTSISPGISDVIGDKAKRRSGSERWLFTWNNYPENWVALMAPWIDVANQWIGGYEIAKTTGTPHIQGYIEFKVKTRPFEKLKYISHWGDKYGRPAMATRAENIRYCTKEKRGYEGTLKPPRELPLISLYGWQLDVMEKQKAEPVQRKIYWYWGPSNCGKSDAVRWLVGEGAIICGGSAADMKYMIVKYNEENGDFPETIVFDIPKCKRKLEWGGVEELVNGVFASTKYECKPVMMPYTRIFVFANWEAPTDDLFIGADRFVITEVP